MSFLKSIFVIIIILMIGGVMFLGLFAIDTNEIILPFEKTMATSHAPEIHYACVNIGDNLSISGSCDPSTGYTWMDPYYDPNFVVLASKHYENDFNGYILEKFNFNLIKKGDTQIVMCYKKPCDEGIGHLVIYQLKIV